MRSYQRAERHPLRVPHTERLRFESSLRDRTQHIDDPDDACAEALIIGREFSWANARDVADALVNIKGTGWGAIYLHWLYRKDD